MLVQGIYVLHSRKYRETSLLVRILTKDYGLLSAVAKGGLQAQNRSLLQPFQPLSVTLSGKTSLQSLYKPELDNYQLPIPGKALLAGLYANELLVRFCAEQDPHPASYIAYCDLLDSLRLEASNIACCLRIFEWQIFADTGYALDCSRDIDNRPLEADTTYSLDEHWKLKASRQGKYKGSDMISINQRDFHLCPQTAKRLSRDIISRIIGTSGLQSWKLFR